jgi:hypothetical protein
MSMQNFRRNTMYAAVCRLAPNVRSFGPYLLMELLLPGGTLFALLLWLSQGITRGGLMGVHQPVASPTTVERVVTPGTTSSPMSGARA